MKLFEDLPSTNTPINAENLNQIKDNLVVVSATEPTGDNREKVWMQKSKNMININNLRAGFVSGTGILETQQTQAEMRSDYIKVKSNTQYTFSIIDTVDTFENWFGVGEFTNSKTFIKRNVESNSSATKITFTTSDTTNYIVVSARNLANATKIQLEQGTTVTEHEEYIDPAIYVKNDNDVYEEFYKTNETRWIKLGSYDNYYRKVNGNVEISANIANSSGITLNSYGHTVLGTLPTEFIPNRELNMPVLAKVLNGDSLSRVRVVVGTNGAVSLFNWGRKSNSRRYLFSYKLHGLEYIKTTD